MRAMDIAISGIETFRVKDMVVKHCPNKHVMISIEGYISDKETESIRRMALVDSLFEISLNEKGSKKCLYGYIYDMEIKHLLHDTYLSLQLISASAKMDREKKTRTFQRPGTTIYEIMEYICKPYEAILTLNGKDKPIGDIVVQYQETDWEFLKRLASQLNMRVIVNNSTASLIMDIGLPQNKSAIEISQAEMTYKNDFKILRKDLDYDISEADVECVMFDSRDMLHVTDAITTNKGEFYIFSVESCFQSEELVMKYVGYRMKNYQTSGKRNANIVGASLDGTVKSVSGTTVQVSLQVDNGNSLCGNKNFAYSTVYSSDTGTGWYCMPEVGDAIRLYFPSAVEKNAYVISSVHLDVTVDSTSRSDPSIKSISNAQNKKIVFAPEEISITNENGMSITLSDTEGISIISDMPVFINSDTSITLNAKDSIYINGEMAVRLEQGSDMSDCPTAIHMENREIHVMGTEFRIQENS